MKIEIPYGIETLKLEIPDENFIGVFGPKVGGFTEAMKVIQDSARKPIGKEPLEEFLSRPGRTVVIVNDQTRATPTAKVLDALPPLVSSKSDFLIATGGHKAPNDAELHTIFGEHLETIHNKIKVHDCDNDAMVNFGKTSRGTELYFNKLAAEADKVVVVGSVEPHYFAGFTGGRKAILPGISSRATIEGNHAFAFSPEARLLSLCDNPVHEDMVEAVRIFGSDRIFSIQIVLDGARNLYSVVSGDIDKSFDRAVCGASEVFCPRIDEAADIVVASVCPPMDIDLYQSHKAIENCRSILKKGGIMLLVSKCNQGVGPSGFYDLMAACSDREEMVARARARYTHGNHKVVRLVEAAARFEMWAVTDLPDEVIETTLMKPFTSVGEAIIKALEKKGKAARLAMILDATATVPVLV